MKTRCKLPNDTVILFRRGSDYLLALREFDKKFLFDETSTNEQAHRAGLRQAIVNQSLELLPATKEEIQFLKSTGSLGKRAPSCSLLTSAGMINLLNYFGKKQIAERLRLSMVDFPPMEGQAGYLKIVTVDQADLPKDTAGPIRRRRRCWKKSDLEKESDAKRMKHQPQSTLTQAPFQIPQLYTQPFQLSSQNSPPSSQTGCSFNTPMSSYSMVSSMPVSSMPSAAQRHNPSCECSLCYQQTLATLEKFQPVLQQQQHSPSCECSSCYQQAVAKLSKFHSRGFHSQTSYPSHQVQIPQPICVTYPNPAHSGIPFSLYEPLPTLHPIQLRQPEVRSDSPSTPESPVDAGYDSEGSTASLVSDSSSSSPSTPNTSHTTFKEFPFMATEHFATSVDDTLPTLPELPMAHSLKTIAGLDMLSAIAAMAK